MSGRRLLLLRHGQTAFNAEGRFQGQCDVPLDAVGRSQAEVAARAIAARRPTRLVSSDAARARATAEVVADACGVGVEFDERLREIDVGDWSGRTAAEVAEEFPAEFAAWVAGEGARRGGGETFVEVAERALAAVEPRLGALAAGALLVVVTHGVTARLLAARLLGLPPSCWRALTGLPNAGWSSLREDDYGWRLVEHGVVAPPVD